MHTNLYNQFHLSTDTYLSYLNFIWSIIIIINFRKVDITTRDITTRDYNQFFLY